MDYWLFLKLRTQSHENKNVAEGKV